MQVSPELILTNLLQLLAIPACVGRGVAMPFAPTVWVTLVVVVVDVGGTVVERITLTTAVGINEPPGGLYYGHEHGR